MKTIKFLILPVLLSAFIVLMSATTYRNRETEKIHSSVIVLRDFARMKESIPRDLLRDCQGVVIIPNLLNAGFVAGAKRGRGVAMVKLDDGRWSDPVFVTLTGGSIGLQIGVQSTDLVLVFRHKGVLANVKNGDVTIGGDASAAVGPIGRSTSASTDYKAEAEVYSYSRSRGLFAGISINGASLSIDRKADTEYYGSVVTTHDIFETAKSTTGQVGVLKETLASMQ